MSIITRASERALARAGASLPFKTEAQRRWLEPPLVAVGAGIAAAFEQLPADLVLRSHDRLFRALAGRNYPYDPADPILREARELAASVERETGRAPALLSLISHPPVLGDLAHLNFLLVRHAMLALRAIRGRPCRPRLVVAIDPFALDTIPLHQEALYAGAMGRYHIGFDRLSVGRHPLSALFLRRCAWPRMAHRLVGQLWAGGEAGMVLAGGVPATARALYATREWTRRQAQRGVAASPEQALERLRRLPDFQRFERESPHGPALSRSAWRMAEAYVMAAASGLSAAAAPLPAATEHGSLTSPARAAARAVLEAFGMEAEKVDAALAELSDEIGRETPYRARFFRLLAGRVLRRRRPIVFVPVVHAVDGAPSVHVRPAWAWVDASEGRIAARQASGRRWNGSPEDFAVAFVRENFR